MTDVFAEVGWQSLGWFWIPVLTWTLGAGLILGALSRFRYLHPLVGYRLRQAIFLALPVSVLAARWTPRWLGFDTARAGGAIEGLGGLAVPVSPVDWLSTGSLAAESSSMDSLLIGGPSPMVQAFLGLGLILISGFAVVHLAVLGFRVYRLRRMREQTAEVTQPAVLRAFAHLKDELGVTTSVDLVTHPDCEVPMTFRWTRPLVVVPVEMLSAAEDLSGALSHELIHIRRMDYEWGVLEQIVAACFAFHPLTWVSRRSIDHFREASCDAEVMAAGTVSPNTYAELLFTMAVGRDPASAAAPCFMNRTSNLRKRLETMERFSGVPNSKMRSRWSVIAGAAMVLVVGGVGACSGGGPELRETAKIAASSPEALGIPDPSQARQRRVARLEVQVPYLRQKVDSLQAEWLALVALGESTGRVLEHHGVVSVLYQELLQEFEILHLETMTDEILAAR